MSKKLATNILFIVTWLISIFMSDKNKNLHLLVFTTLFPNNVQPRHGIFVKARLWQLLSQQGVRATVIAPVPWFPLRSKIFGKYGEYARVEKLEVIDGVEIYHPRYLVIPKIGSNLTPYFLYRAAKRITQKLAAKLANINLIDAHYCYPDGVAAVKLGNLLNKPVVITARGSDINLIPQYDKPKKMIAKALQEVAHIVTVSEALKTNIEKIFDVDSKRITVLRNGVDHTLFKPLDRQKYRKELGINGKTLLSVGNLVEIKGHDLAIKAIAQLENIHLYIAGDGPERRKLEQLCSQLEVEDRVVFLGTLTQLELITYYNIADGLLLLSSREGLANVLLESMACGTPVIATAVGGTPEVVLSEKAGILIKERTVKDVVEGIVTLFDNPPQRQDTQKYAEQFSWHATTQGQRELFNEIS